MDAQDLTIQHALVREVREGTGLEVMKIIAELKPMTYTTEKNIVNDNGEKILVSKSAIQLNYVISVSEGDVKVNPDEHSESLWVTEQDLDKLEITNAMRVVVQEAFKWAAG